MDQPFYEFSIFENAFRFEFESVGIHKIRKVILYDKTDIPHFYNLSLGDTLPDGKVSFISISNNGDRDRVMATVIQTLLYFFDIYPEAYVLFSGSTPERTRLYQIIIARELTYATATFSFWGMDEDGVLHPFAKNKSYIGFIISLKTQLPTI